MEDLVSPLGFAPSLLEVLERSYGGRRVLITGHNGFVGSWLSLVLADAGAQVTGLSLPEQRGGLSEALKLEGLVESLEGDIVDPSVLQHAVAECRPEVVFHLAAQALVIASYREPLVTFATNVMGTAHLLEAVRRQPSVRACVVVTSDKCYATGDDAHRESDPLGGNDPYSASKAAAELVTAAYRTSFFGSTDAAVATTRAGNIVGGGDWADDRIVPDCARAAREGRPLALRRPDAVRPWQHVLDAVGGYLRLGDALLLDPLGAAGAWNFGPPAEAAVTVGEFVAALLTSWRSKGVEVMEPMVEQAPSVAERGYLALDSGKARSRLGWRPHLDLAATANWTVDWYAAALHPGFDARQVTGKQVARFLSLDQSREASPPGDRDGLPVGTTSA